MGFLRRILGGGADDDVHEGAPATETPDEIERDRELLQEEAVRLDNDLIQRQLRYADRVWTPPAQGGARRAEDDDKPAG